MGLMFDAGQLPLDAAMVRYAEMGLWVFPCRPGTKVPNGLLVSHGHTMATHDSAVARSWVHQVPDSNIGCVPALAGLWAVDVDGPVGVGSWIALEEEFGYTPTLKTVSPGKGGGEHYWFHVPGGPDVAKRVSKKDIAPKVTVYGAGGYVMLPPSVHPGDEMTRSGFRYRYADDTNAAWAPAWLIEAVAAEAPATTGSTSAVLYSDAELDDILRDLSTAQFDSYGLAALNARVSEIRSSNFGSVDSGRHPTVRNAVLRLLDLALEGRVPALECIATLLAEYQRVASDGRNHRAEVTRMVRWWAARQPDLKAQAAAVREALRWARRGGLALNEPLPRVTLDDVADVAVPPVSIHDMPDFRQESIR